MPRQGRGRAGTEQPRRRLRRQLIELPVLVAIAILIAFALKTFVAQAYFIPSASMEPQLRAGDRVLVSRLAYRVHEPRRGDIVVFDEPGREAPDDRSLPVRIVRDVLEGVGLARPDETELIKRVIGLPGETIAAAGGTVLIDGNPLIEPYLPDTAVTEDFGPVVVPDDHVFVMGDNRTSSLDSRRFGTVPIDSIAGRALVRAWPPGRWAYL